MKEAIDIALPWVVIGMFCLLWLALLTTFVCYTCCKWGMYGLMTGKKKFLIENNIPLFLSEDKDNAE